MVDLRSKIIALAEESLHSFIEERIQVLNMREKWKNGFESFVNEQYESHPDNMEGIYHFLKTHTVDDVVIEDLDITALVPILLYFENFKNLYSIGFKDAIKNSFQSCFYDFRSIRNLIRHYTEEISEKQREGFIIDQFGAVCSIIRFSTVCVKNCNRKSYWKKVLNKALYLQGRIRREKWFVLEEEKDREYSPEEDFSDIEMAAENGNVSAQVTLGKIIYDGKRYGMDRDKAFMWFYKAAKQNNAEAMYYMAKCYQSEAGVEFDPDKADKWVKNSSDMGYAPALNERAMDYIAKVDISEDEKKIMIDLLSKAAEQEYPEAIWNLSVCYSLGRGVELDLDKARELAEKSALLGFEPAAKNLAERAVKNKDTVNAKKWYEIALRNNSEGAKYALEKYEKCGHF